MSRFRVTIRGEGTEVRGYATGEALAALAAGGHEAFIVVASPVDDDYNPFIPPPESEEKGKVGP